MKAIALHLDDQVISAQLGSKITKADLYGEVTRQVEKDGRVLERGVLLPDGRLLRRSQFTSVSMDAEGSPAESLAYVEQESQAEVEAVASSFDSGLALRMVPLVTLASFTTADVYDLDAAGIKPGLYATSFNYRKSFQSREALALIKESGEAYLLIGASRRTVMVGQQTTYEFFDTEESEGDEADPLDFSMM